MSGIQFLKEGHVSVDPAVLTEKDGVRAPVKRKAKRRRRTEKDGVRAPVKRKAKRRRRSAPRQQAKVVPFKAPSEFAGMTKLECCTDCNAERCIISGANYCAHPMKSGLQPTGDQQVIARYGRAKKALAFQKLEEDEV